MRQYLFSAIRSHAAEHQVKNMTCNYCVVSGQMPASSSREVFQAVAALCVVPGVWTIMVENCNSHRKCNPQILDNRKDAPCPQ